MELVEGSTLKELIRGLGTNNGQPMPLHQAVDIAIQICAGVGYAHRAKLIHCDMKSQNVLISPDNQVKVTDFGIARALSEASLHEDSQIWGTPQYFSPEQAAGQSPTTASDVYSIGVILFEMLAGKLPFNAESHTAMALKHIQELPPNVSTVNPAVPDLLARVVEKVLSKEPAGRYRTADQLGRVLKTYRDNSEEETGPVNRDLAAAAVLVEISSGAVSTREAGSTALAKTRLPEDFVENSEQAEIILTLDDLDEKEKGADWLAVILGIIALISLLGLIPLWYTIYQLYTG
jgi:serine/threonine-protein kinase